MSSIFYLEEEEENDKEESISKYNDLFVPYLSNMPTLNLALYEMYVLSKLSAEKALDLTNDIIINCMKKVDSNLTKIRNKYPNISRDDAIIISSYTCESKDENYSPYRVLNKNLVSEDRKNGIKIVSKYLFLFLFSLRKLPRYIPNKMNSYLYRCINKHINYTIDPLNPNAKPYIIGNSKTFWGFTSTSPNVIKTYKFLGQNQSFKSGTIFILSGNIWGYDITLFNVYKEEEILLEPERKFTIINILPKINELIQVQCKIEDSPLVLNYIPSIYQIQMQTQILQNKIPQLNIVNKSNISIQNQNFVVSEPNISSISTDKKINIKFIKGNIIKKYYDSSGSSLSGFLKLCLLQEIANKINNNYINQFPEPLRTTMRILKNNYFSQTKEPGGDIRTILNKSGNNIMNFSSFINNEVKSEYMDQLLKYLQTNEQKEIKDIINRLSPYEELIKLFNKEFIVALRESIFEFSVASAIIIERNDFERFKIEREKCPNLEERILFHGTQVDCISRILTGLFMKATGFGQRRGVYFTDQIDYCRFYGSQKNSRDIWNKIPSKDEEFTMIVCWIYYDKKKFLRVEEDYFTRERPGKNEINFAYVGENMNTLLKPEMNKICFHDYAIYDLDQICPFLSIKLKREEYCIIWRDINFSAQQINNNSNESIRNILVKQLSYIRQYINYNVYPCDSTEEAIKLVKRKKFNKIILISNIGNDYGGKIFIDEARKLLCSDVIVLFFVHDMSKHLGFVPNYKNALISNETNILERYVKCFNGTSSHDIMKGIINIKIDLEKKYNKKFNFSQDFLTFPLYKDSGKYSELKF